MSNYQQLEEKLRQLTLGGESLSSPSHEDAPKNDKGEICGSLPFEGRLKSTLKEISNVNWKDEAGTCDKFKKLIRDTLQIYEKDIATHENGTPNSVHVLQDKMASALIVLKAVAETPLTTTGLNLNETNQSDLADPDYFWNIIIHPNLPAVYHYMSQFFRYCEKNLTFSNESLNGGLGSEEDLPITSSAGFARHQILGLLQNGVRTVLVFQKRGLVNLEYSDVNDDHQKSVDKNMESMGLALCDILNSESDVGLDIRCGIGLVVTGLILYRSKGWNSVVVTYFENIFSNSIEGVGTVGLLENVALVARTDSNRIGLAIGILCSVNFEECNVDLSTLMYLIFKHMLELDHGTKEALNLGTARVIEMLMDKISHPNTPIAILEKVFPLFATVEFFVLSYIPGHIDAVKNCCRNVLASLTKIYQRIHEEQIVSSTSSSELIETLLKKILSKDAHVKYIALACVTRNSPLSIKALELDQDMPLTLLSATRSCKNPANESYISLMSYDFPLLDRSDWERRWITPLFTTQPNQTQESWSQKKMIIKTILKCQKSSPGLQAMSQPLLKFVINRMNSTETELEKQVTESIMLAAETIKIASELGLEIELDKSVKDGDSFRGLIPRTVLNSWLWNENPQIRLAGSFLLVETKKTTQIFLPEDFDSLKIFLKYNLVSQNPAFRQEFTSCFKKLVLRLKAGHGLLKRKRELQSLENYDKFFVWMWEFFTGDEGLFTGATFGRRCQSLECLSNLLEVFQDSSMFGVQSTDSNLKYLSWLIDSYENNKARALEILLKIPIPAFQAEDKCQLLYDEALSFCESVKPPDSTTGRYLMVLLMKKTKLPTYSAANILKLLLEKLEKTYAAIVATSLTQVSCERPMYGVIRCIRMILDSTEDYKREGREYQTYFAKLIPLLLQFDEILFPLLGNAAPEGFLPGLPDSSEDNNQVVRSITAQMLLVCSWRSMRDICMLFADMVVVLPLEGEKPKPKKNRSNNGDGEYILSCSQVSLIGEHMLSLMKNLVHRGVFEQVFVGFKTLATRLWESSNPSLCSLPSKWLNAAIDEQDMSSKCITRRSAGLPFIFQALLTAECDNPIFMGDWVMRLFIRDESPMNSSVRIHALNSLRGLFRDANFSKAMMPFVPDGLRVAFRGLKSEDWTERNAGLMLYGALIRRTFGPKLNLMSAPTFFRRFPQMYDFLLGELDVCLKVLNRATSPTTPIAVKTAEDNQECSDFTFHLLLLLASFAPAGRVEDEHFKLSEFIVKLRQCAVCPDIEVRKLAAKAIIPFLNSPNDYSVMLNIVAEMLESGIAKLPINHVHGNLIQMAVIMKYITKDNSEIIIQALSKLLTRNYFNSLNCPTVFETVAELILAFDNFVHPTLRKFYKLLANAYYTRFDPSKISDRNTVPGLVLADATIAKGEILFTLSAVSEIDSSNSDSPDSDKLLFETMYYWLTSYRLVVFLEQLLDHLCSNNCIGLVDKMFNVLGPSSEILLQTLIACYCQLIITYIGQSELELKFLHLLSKINNTALENCFHHEETRELMDQLLDRLITICIGSCATTEHQRLAMICLCKLSFGTDIEIKKEHMEQLCTTLLEWTGSTVDDDLRFGAALGIPKIPLRGSLLKLSVVNQCKIWLAVMNLAQDDDLDIRSIVNAKVLSSNTNEMAGCDRKSLENFVACFFGNLVKSHPLAGLTLLMGSLFRDDFEIKTEEANDDDEGRLFDKSEMNTFSEPMILAKVIKEYLISRNLAKCFKNVFDQTLTPELIELYELASNAKLYVCSPTLSSLVNIVNMRLNSEEMEPNPDCDKVCSVGISTMHAVQTQILKMIMEVFL